MNIIRNLGFKEILIIVLLLIVFFGSKRISALARNAGKSSKELKKTKKEYDEAVQEINKPVRDKKDDHD
jgi:TatA/E family protein of Tat protein translocase